MRFITAAVLLILNLFHTESQACKGCLSLDEYNFDKILDRFKAVLVKFDVAYPYGEKHETFTKFADGVTHSKDLVLATVGVKDYGERDNEQLAQRFGISGKDGLPAVRLFVNGDRSPIELAKDADFTLDSLRNLVRDHTDIYIGLPGCLEAYDRIAMRFADAANKERELKEAEKLTETLKDEAEKGYAQVYVKFMRKIIENGAGFVKQEVSRLKKILKEGKINEKKKEELSNRLNVLHSFELKKDEL